MCSSSAGFPAALLQPQLNISSAGADPYQGWELVFLWWGTWEQTAERLLPRVDGAGRSVVAVVHSVRSPAVAPHTLGAVVSGHSQVLKKKTPNRKDT